MTARLIMNSSPVVLHHTDKIHHAAEHIMEHRMRRIPVVDEEGHYIGVFGINCLLRMVLPKAVLMKDGLESASFLTTDLSDLHHRYNEIMDQPVTICMTDEAKVISPDTPLIETLRILYNYMGSLPVVDPDDGRLLGMVSYWDVGAAILATKV